MLSAPECVKKTKIAKIIDLNKVGKSFQKKIVSETKAVNFHTTQNGNTISHKITP